MSDTTQQQRALHQSQADESDTAAMFSGYIEIQIQHPKFGHDAIMGSAKCDPGQEFNSVSRSFVDQLHLVNEAMEEDISSLPIYWALFGSTKIVFTIFEVEEDQEEEIVFGAEACRMVKVLHDRDVGEPTAFPVWSGSKKDPEVVQAHRERIEQECEQEQQQNAAASEAQHARETHKKPNSQGTHVAGSGQTNSGQMNSGQTNSGQMNSGQT